MQMTAHGKKRPMHQRRKIPFLILLSLAVSLVGFSQNITLSLKNATLEKVFREIEKKTSHRFVYTKEMAMQGQRVTIEVSETPLVRVLELVFDSQPLEYTLGDEFITVRFKRNAIKPLENAAITVQGKVTDEKGDPVRGATVSAAKDGKATATDITGSFILRQIEPNDEIVVTSVGYIAKKIPVNGRANIDIQLAVLVSTLDETVVIAYGTTTRRLNTGNISKVTSEEISKQPVNNVLAAMQGRVPGLLITQSSGYAGSAFQIQLRGQNSLLQGTQPFFVVDGVPMATGNNAINQINNAAFQLNPFYTINPADIESIEVLKDADATAIYGSRGANGVVLITTKKGKGGKTKLNLNVYTGISRAGRTMPFLTTRQYLQMRREAMVNDGLPATTANAADLLLWDTTRYTDFRKLFIGGTANTLDAQLSLSGGNSTTQFLLGAGYHRETTVLPTSLADNRASFHFNFNHQSADKKMSVSLKSLASILQVNLPVKDLTSVINRPPNMQLYDSLGKLNWQEGGVSFRSLNIAAEYSNPLAILRTRYNGNYKSFSSNLQLTYALFPALRFKTNTGYNLVSGDEVRTNPSTSIDPFGSQLPFSSFANSNQGSWIVEPQAEYSVDLLKGKLNVLAGATWQINTNKGNFIDASNYSSDLLLNSVAGAGLVVSNNSYSQYRYSAVFGRITQNWYDTYILNLTARRDGSSRFGPANQFNTFGAIGGAWIFSKEKAVSKLAFLSFGKLRASYGLTGNDQVGDYKFIDSWSASSTTYQQSPVLVPSSLFNPNLAWETNRKFEVSLDLGFLADRLLFSVAYFDNRSGDQLINYSLPIQTGFTSISRNLNALIQNKGFEISLISSTIKGKNILLTNSFNITTSRNKLLAFPGLALSSYANQYIIGEPLSVSKLYEYTGIDPVTGVYTFTDQDKNGTLSTVDRTILKTRLPKFYGGFRNNLKYKNFEIDLFFEFKKQAGTNYLGNLARVPGIAFYNQPAVVLNRWRQPGDRAAVGKFTSTTSTAAYRAAASFLNLSDGALTDASFIRCKNICLSFNIPEPALKKLHLQGLRVYVQAQNVFIITRYKGADPENQDINVLPPLRTITGGIQVNF